MATAKRNLVKAQIRRRILSDLHLGALVAGARLPSVRTVAAELGVNARLVLRAYGELAEEGLVELRPRSGMFVANFQQLSHDQERRTNWLISIASEALQHGIRTVDLPQQLGRAFTSRHVRAAVIECNQDQLYSITHELRNDYGMSAEGVVLRQLAPGAALPAALRDANVLISTPHHAPAVESLARKLGKPRIIMVMCTGLYALVDQLMKKETVFFIVTDPHFAVKLRGLLSPAAINQRLEILVYGRDDLLRIPEQAPVYITQVTRARLRHASPSWRILSDEQIFSSESARELVEFVVRTNVAATATATARERSSSL